MRVETFSCEVCKKQRDSDTNHWFIVTEGGLAPSTLIIERWSSASQEAINQAKFHLCGQDHLIKTVAEWAAQP